MNTQANPNPRRALSYLNSVLTVIAVLLAVLVLSQYGTATSAQSGVVTLKGGSPSSGSAVDPDDDGPGPDGRVSAAEQRKTMISEMRTMSKKLDQVADLLAKGISVKVTSMPELKLPKEKN